MSLYHIYRPNTFEGIIGNFETISAIQNFLENPETMPLVYLFHGPTGTGKTTLARIIKNQLETEDIDYIESNASEDRGINEIKEISRKSNYKPLQSDFKIYVLDECHQLTKPAQEALLKKLEDTPKHVLFILCTTEPEKLGKALRGRCQEFQLSLLKDDEMKRLIKKVSRKEGGSLESEVIQQIIESANGHPRNALQILEKVLNVPEDERINIAKKWIDDKSEAIELCRALLKKESWKKISAILSDIKGQEPESIRRMVLGYASSVLLNTNNSNAALILEEFSEPFYNTGFPGLVYACYASTIN